MDTSALRKLSMTLKPLIDIADAFDKISSVEETIACLNGKKVAAQRDYDALTEKINSDKKAADIKIAAMIENAQKESQAIINKGKQDADAAAKKMVESAASRLDSLIKQVAAFEKDAKEWDEKVKVMKARASASLAVAEEAEKKHNDIKAAVAAMRV